MACVSVASSSPALRAAGTFLSSGADPHPVPAHRHGRSQDGRGRTHARAARSTDSHVSCTSQVRAAVWSLSAGDVCRIRTKVVRDRRCPHLTPLLIAEATFHSISTRSGSTFEGGQPATSNPKPAVCSMQLLPPLLFSSSPCTCVLHSRRPVVTTSMDDRERRPPNTGMHMVLAQGGRALLSPCPSRTRCQSEWEERSAWAKTTKRTVAHASVNLQLQIYTGRIALRHCPLQRVGDRGRRRRRRIRRCI